MSRASVDAAGAVVAGGRLISGVGGAGGAVIAEGVDVVGEVDGGCATVAAVSNFGSASTAAGADIGVSVACFSAVD
jgi:hypothetical protein